LQLKRIWHLINFLRPLKAFVYIHTYLILSESKDPHAVVHWRSGMNSTALMKIVGYKSRDSSVSVVTGVLVHGCFLSLPPSPPTGCGVRKGQWCQFCLLGGEEIGEWKFLLISTHLPSLIVQIAVVIMRCLIQHGVLIVSITVYPYPIIINCILTIVIEVV
jgi:hypothetical protein